LPASWDCLSQLTFFQPREDSSGAAAFFFFFFFLLPAIVMSDGSNNTTQCRWFTHTQVQVLSAGSPLFDKPQLDVPTNFISTEKNHFLILFFIFLLLDWREPTNSPATRQHFAIESSPMMS
jgi:hypothetical protein